MARVLGRVWLVGLLVLGLVVSLLGVAPPEGALGAHGEEDIDFAPMYSACVGAATESAGFEDTADIGAEDAINCLFHYGITTGRSETMYAPGDSVLRWQMALFLARAAAAAGIVLENPAEDQGFTDVGAVSEEARNAINGLAKAGIMPGTSATTFSPNSSVNRGSMAMLLDAFLAQATPGAGAFGEAAEKYADVKADNFNVFTDVSTVSLNTYNAIYRIYELGVTKGVGEHQFNPSGLVTRGQMASFITRAFAHTIARPSGVSIQSEQDMVLGAQGVPLIVSVRDVNFQPVQDASVDVFRSTDPDNAFGDDGACVSASVDKVATVGQTACEVDLGDSTTDASGDLTDLSLQITDADVSVWAWTGDRGDKFDSDDTTAAQLTVGFSKAASQTLVTDNLEEGQEKSKFGETVTVTIQIADEDDKAVADKGKRITVAQSTTVGDNTTSSTNSMTTDADGKIVLEFTQTDPDANSTGQTAMLTLRLSGAPAGLPLQNEDGSAFDMDGKTYIWSDETPVPTTLTMSARTNFGAASDEGSGAGNTVTATLTDQFGEPVRGKRISFLSDTFCTPKRDETTCSVTGIGVTENGGVATEEDDGVRVLTGTARFMRTTGRDGRANLSYSYDSTDSTIETIWATYPFAGTEGVRGFADTVVQCGEAGALPAGRCRPADDMADETVLPADRIYHYWAEDPGGAPFTGRILVKDPDNDQLVVAAEEKLMLVKYDANDQFVDFDGPTVMAEFEKPLAENADPAAAHLKVTTYEDEAGKVSTFTLQPEWPTLQHPDGTRAGAGARFGNAVAADNGVIVVGAWFETVDPDTGSGDVDSDSDMTNDASDDLSRAGRVYIYPNGFDTDPDDIIKLQEPTPGERFRFGYDVDVSGNTVVVGTFCTQNNDCVVGSKKVYVYERSSGGTWSTTPDATFTDANYNRGFGEGVAVSGDEKTIAVVAPASANGGAVIVYEKGAGWGDDSDASDNARLKDTSAAEGNAWNGERSVAISKDGSVILSGACGWNNSPPPGVENCYGLVNLYERSGNSWGTAVIAEADVTFQSNGGQRLPERFGKYVAISEDGSTFVASGHFHADANKPGSAYVFTEPAGGWSTLDTDPAVTARSIQGAELSVSRGRPADVFGQYIAITKDGSEVAAGRHYRQEGDFRGSVVTFKRPSGGWADDSSPDDEYLGPWVNAHLGWATTYDKTTGDLYTGLRDEVTIKNPPSGHKLLTVYKITR